LRGTQDKRRRFAWLSSATAAIGVSSFFSDVGHEIPTSLLPSFLIATLGAPASALGLIEGVADGAAGVAKVAGGALADDPGKRGAVAVGGYTTTAILSSSIGFATAPIQVGILRAGAWAGSEARRATHSSPIWSNPPRTDAPTASNERWTTSGRSWDRSSRSSSWR
jgi:hypothetical protein